MVFHLHQAHSPSIERSPRSQALHWSLNVVFPFKWIESSPISDIQPRRRARKRRREARESFMTDWNMDISYLRRRRRTLSKNRGRRETGRHRLEGYGKDGFVARVQSHSQASSDPPILAILHHRPSSSFCSDRRGSFRDERSRRQPANGLRICRLSSGLP
ncbi:hypothetical protein SCHPADRAFT_750099 [Schizopora paradoxa]|uniref:Uncharacterized protein n=1 Tax=Schizopora paradoxa TaxID=27342 RepID=A0A0H2QYW4_9AGAM|nr:hypothetical protein SCHPADRAFT_750099 [Schizopora paradoxa]